MVLYRCLVTLGALLVCNAACNKKQDDAAQPACASAAESDATTDAAATALTDCTTDGATIDPTKQPTSGSSSGGLITTVGSLVAGTGPTFSDITKSSYSISWTAATGSTTPDQVEYQLITAASTTGLATLADAEAVTPADVIVPYTKGALSHAVTGLAPLETHVYAVIAKNPSGNKALYPAQSVTTLDLDAPAPGADISFGLVTDTSFSIYWGAASSPVTAQANLQYKVVKASNSGPISTIAGAESATGADVVLDWTTNRTGATYIPAGVVAGAQTYFIAVLVKDQAGRKAIYTPKDVTTLHHKMVFVTSATFDASTLGNLNVADGYCNAEKPAGRGNFKALISHSAARVACLHADCVVGMTTSANDGFNWIMTGNTTYETKDGATLWTTDAAGIVYRSSTFSTAIDTNDLRVWTGFNSDWTTGANCNNWSSNSSSDSGIAASSFFNDARAWSWLSNRACDGKLYGGAANYGRLYCVEQ